MPGVSSLLNIPRGQAAPVKAIASWAGRRRISRKTGLGTFALVV